MVSLWAPRPVRVKSLWREGGKENERRKGDGDMGKAGERIQNNRGSGRSQTIMQFTFVFNLGLFFSPNSLPHSSEYQFYIPLLI